MKKKTTMLLSVLFVLGILFVWTAPVHAIMPFDVEKAIQKGDHKGLADYYHSEAEAQRKIAEMHDKMKEGYKKTHVHYKGIENTLAGHCGNLKLEVLKMAEQYDALAKEEEKMIK